MWYHGELDKVVLKTEELDMHPVMSKFEFTRSQVQIREARLKCLSITFSFRSQFQYRTFLTVVSIRTTDKMFRCSSQ
jgi:hypothetical protein